MSTFLLLTLLAALSWLRARRKVTLHLQPAVDKYRKHLREKALYSRHYR